MVSTEPKASMARLDVYKRQTQGGFGALSAAALWLCETSALSGYSGQDWAMPSSRMGI